MKQKCPMCSRPVQPRDSVCSFCKYKLSPHCVDDTDNGLGNDPVFLPDNPLTDDQLTIFSRPDWKQAWETFAAVYGAGIILTNTADLSPKEPFLAELKAFISHREAEDVHYTLLDLATQRVGSVTEPDCEAMVQLLTKIYAVALPRYLMIVGDSTVIPSKEWPNGCYDHTPHPFKKGDSDSTVISDLPYVTLTTASPWEGMDFDFTDVTQVGRVPTTAKNQFSEAITYFKNARAFTHYSDVRGFALSAKVWDITSRTVFADLHTDVLLSSPYTADGNLARQPGYTPVLPLGNRFNLLGFNLHGSRTSNHWFGQSGSSYPIAFKKELFPDETCNGYALCTEACYGAKPTVTADPSMLVYAMTHRCQAFVGSTKIAYGYAQGGMCCADVIAHSFLGAVAAGQTYGAALLCAYRDLTAKDRLDSVEIKTLAEFALYGDPAGSLIARNQHSKAFTLHRPVHRSRSRIAPAKATGFQSLEASLPHLSLLSHSDNGSRAMSKAQKVELIQTHITNETRRFAKQHHNLSLKDEPNVFSVLGRNEYAAVYRTGHGDSESFCVFMLDEKGHVSRMYHTK